MKLSEIKKQNPFAVPDGYFDEFLSRLQDKLGEQKDAKKRSLYYSLKPYIYSVASVAAIVLAILVFYKISGNKHSETALLNSEIALAFEDDIYDLDEMYIIENYTERQEAEEMVYDYGSDPTYKDEIIRYLLDEDIEIESIADEL
ncbi:MAG: hypothetical protein JXB24_04075 [Bacteroidales bacterium]|jgi:hypothetical protein|nr:hypothetical protein [Bacteroidales bacterium]